MCGRFNVDDETLEEIRKILREIDAKAKYQQFSGDIHPTEFAPVLIQGKSGIKLTKQQWGYPGVNNKGIIINARCETVTEKRMFQNGIYRKRAVIPAKHFYEWNKLKEKNIFKRTDKKILYMAGFYDNFNGIDKFIILTTAANESMINTHQRMPLILEDNQLEQWISDDNKVGDILHQVPVHLSKTADYEQLTLF